MACEPEVMVAEATYLEILTKVRAADVTDRKRLVLTGDDGARLSFTAAPPLGSDL